MSHDQINNDTNITLHSGLGDVADDYEYFILDIWGVLHNGIRPFPGTVACLQNLKKDGKRILLLSNTPDRGELMSRRLAAMGIGTRLYDHIVTAGDSARYDLTERQGQRCWYAGSDGEGLLTAGLDIEHADHPDHADFIVNVLFGLGPAEKKTAFALLERAQEKSLPMLCANPDLIVNVGPEIKECPGTYALYYEEIGGTVIYHGKPHAPVYRRAWELLGRPDKNRMVAVGDSLHTDIQGANNFGIDSIMNLSGIHREEILHDQNPDDIDSQKLKTMIDGQPHKPNMFLNGFRW